LFLVLFLVSPSSYFRILCYSIVKCGEISPFKTGEDVILRDTMLSEYWRIFVLSI